MRSQSPQPSEIVFPAALEPAEDPIVPAAIATPGWGWLEWFMLSQVFWGVLLFIPGAQAYRIYIRAFPYVLSLVALLLILRSKKGALTTPGARWMVAVLALLVCNLPRPETWLLSGTAQIVFQLSIAAPLFWASQVDIDEARLERLIWLVFLANLTSGMLGLLQVYFPERFMPPEFSSLGMQMRGDYVSGMSYVGADGRTIIRPPGLSDQPGGASIAGTFAALLGFGLALRPNQKNLWRIGYLAATFASITVVYLTHVRSFLLAIVVCMMVYAMLRMRKGRVMQATTIAVVAGVLVVGAFIWAVSVGGEAVYTRFFDIAETGVVETFQQNRGFFLSYTLREGLSQYPFGAGVGRWGMMSLYFGETNWLYPALYAEIQITGWLFDGGVFMWILYGGAIVAALRYSYRLAIADVPVLSECAAMVFMIELFVSALCLTGPVFNTQLGIVFWLLGAVLLGAHRTMAAQAAAEELEWDEDDLEEAAG